jgi:hypothetical protein
VLQQQGRDGEPVADGPAAGRQRHGHPPVPARTAHVGRLDTQVGTAPQFLPGQRRRGLPPAAAPDEHARPALDGDPARRGRVRPQPCEVLLVGAPVDHLVGGVVARGQLGVDRRARRVHLFVRDVAAPAVVVHVRQDDACSTQRGRCGTRDGHEDQPAREHQQRHDPLVPQRFLPWIGV